jgi:hypothetical protein
MEHSTQATRVKPVITKCNVLQVAFLGRCSSAHLVLIRPGINQLRWSSGTHEVWKENKDAVLAA